MSRSKPLASMLVLGMGVLAWMAGGCGQEGPAGQDAGLDADDAGSDAGDPAPHDGGDGEADAGEDGGADADVDPCAGVVCGDPCGFYVDPAAPAGGDGASPQTAFDGIQAGIDAAHAGAGECCTCEVLVAEGTFYVYSEGPLDTVLLRDRVHLVGGHPSGFAGDRDPDLFPSVLDGRKDAGGGNPDDDFRVHHVVTGADRAVVDGFTVRGGDARQDDNPFNPNNYGGGMINLDVDLQVRRCKFEDNFAVYGGAMYNSGGAVRVEDSGFTGNSADGLGGAMSNRASDLALFDVRFADNHADSGGGVYNAERCTFSVSGSLPEKCYFSGNSAGSSGGAIASDGATVVISGCPLLDNQAGLNGGAVSSRLGGSLTLSNSPVCLNTAENGGGLYSESLTSVEVSGDAAGDCLLEDNAAGASGGGMFTSGGSLVIRNCAFDANAAVSGGGMFTSGGSLVIRNSSFDQNLAGNADLAGWGGGMYNLDVDSVDISGDAQGDCSFLGNVVYGGGGGGAANSHNTVLTVTNCTFTDNRIELVHDEPDLFSIEGGALRNIDTPLNLTDCVFTGNSASCHSAPYEYDYGIGGAVCNLGGPLTATGCVFQTNRAGWLGGAVYIKNGDTLSLTDCSFLSNEMTDTGNGGPAVKTDQVEVSMTGCTFYDNRVPTDGVWIGAGAVDISRGNTTILNCVFEANRADGSTALSISGYSNYRIEGCLFKDNQAYLYETLHFSYSSGTITNCTFTGNDTTSGPCILFITGAGSHVSVKNSIIWDNPCSAALFETIVGGSLSVDYSDVQGGYAGTGNIEADPLFDAAMPLHPGAGSPCIDSGDNSAVTETEDLDGNPRIVNGVVDMGAYEYQGD